MAIFMSAHTPRVHDVTENPGSQSSSLSSDMAWQLTNLYLLTRIIDAGGFSAAAREMGTTRSLLSRRIIALEKALGTHLLYRDARHFAVTAAGEKVYRHAITMCDAAHAAMAAASEARSPGQGTLRVSMRDALLPLMSDVLTVFAEHYPQMRLTTNTHHDFDILLYQRADVVLHLGSALPDSGDIVARPLGQARLVIVGSPPFWKTGTSTAPRQNRRMPLSWLYRPRIDAGVDSARCRIKASSYTSGQRSYCADGQGSLLGDGAGPAAHVRLPRRVGQRSTRHGFRRLRSASVASVRTDAGRPRWRRNGAGFHPVCTPETRQHARVGHSALVGSMARSTEP